MNKRLSKNNFISLTIGIFLTGIPFATMGALSNPASSTGATGKWQQESSGSLPSTVKFSNKAKVAPITKAKMATMTAWKKKLDTNLLKLVDGNLLLQKETRSQLLARMKELKQFVAKTDSLSTLDQRFKNVVHPDLVYVYVKLNPNTKISAIDSVVWRVTDRDERNHLAVALVDVSKMETLALLTGVNTISSVDAPTDSAGSVTTQGDILQQTSKIRSLYGKTGAGMKIGVISDGVDHIASSISSGDLPAGVTVLSNTVTGDEGTAMLEIIHDIAPDASLYFHDQGSNSIAFNTAVQNLINNGVKVIVDDTTWYTQPFFEDGNVAKNITAVLAENNIIYVSSAGNYSRQHYQGTYYNNGSNLHDFSGGLSSSRKSLYVKIPAGGKVQVVLQWNEPFGSSGSNYDLALNNVADNLPLATSFNIQDGNDNPLEWFKYTNETGATIEAAIDVINYEGLAPAKTLEVFVYPTVGASYYSDNMTPGDSIFGHHAVQGVITVGAVSANDPGNDTIAAYSSRGPVTILGESQRTKPDVVGIDGVSITGAGGFSNPFYGTSAAAPHVAGIAALLWNLFPSKTGNQIKDMIINSAIDLGTAGVDFIFGHGRVDAFLASQIVPSIVSFNFDNPAVTGVIDNTAKTVSITVPAGTNITTIAPTIIFTGASVSPSSGTTQNFTNPVTYTVTSSGSLTQNYAVTVNTTANPDSVLLAADKDSLSANDIRGTNVDLSNVTASLRNPLPSLGVNGSTITWVSGTPSVVSSNGQTVIRPAYGSANATVTFTATLTKGSVSDTKTFTMIILAQTENPNVASDAIKVNADKESLTIGASGDPSHRALVLPSSGANGSTITWVSGTPNLISNNGQIIARPAYGAGNATVTMTATITKGYISDTKTFTLTIQQEGATNTGTLNTQKQTVTTNTSGTYFFASDLEIGAEKRDVQILQAFLKYLGPEIYPEGKITGYFGSLTQKAVKAFQLKYGIASPGNSGYGRVGPKTRGKINQMQGL